MGHFGCAFIKLFESDIQWDCCWFWLYLLITLYQYSLSIVEY